jgi:hypothetical protein
MNEGEFKYLNEIIEFHEKNVQPYKGSPVGCADVEIEDIEKYFGFELPMAYKEYLKFMGKDYQGVFVGSDWFIKHIVGNTEWIPELLRENEIEFELPENYLAFFCHQGYLTAWFELPKLDENPPVWFFKESEDDKPPYIFGTFTEFLFEDMRGMASFLPKLYK